MLDGGVPLLCVEAVEGFVVVAAELGRRLAFELRERLQVPEDKVIGQLADGVIALAVCPVGLLGGEAGDCDVRGDKPFFLIVRASELLEQDASESGGRLFGLVLGTGAEWKSEQKQKQGLFHFEFVLGSQFILGWFQDLRRLSIVVKIVTKWIRARQIDAGIRMSIGF